MESTFKIVFLSTAEEDVEEIAEHLSQYYESTFPKFMTSLRKSITHLEEMPYMGMAYENFRRLVVGDYLVFYKVDEETRIVRIHSILHGTQDISAQLVTARRMDELEKGRQSGLEKGYKPVEEVEANLGLDE